MSNLYLVTCPIRLTNGHTITVSEHLRATSEDDARSIMIELINQRMAGMSTGIGPLSVLAITVTTRPRRQRVRLSRQQQLDRAIAREDYELAAKLRDKSKK